MSNSIPCYSFAYNFNYWDRCKTSTLRQHDRRFMKELYVPPKHDSLKDELLNNNISHIDRNTWQAVCQQAEAHQSENRYRCTAATFLEEFQP
eukprot:27842_1